MSDTQTFVIFGAGGAIGSETARHLRSTGSNVYLVGRNEARLRALSSEIDSPFEITDATDFDAVDAAFKSIGDAAGEVGGVVNCVGSILLKPAHLTTPEEWHDTLSQNLTSSFAILRAAVRAMRGNGGSLVFCSSAAAQIGLPNHEAIAAAKAGIEGLVRSAAASYASKNIRVNAVALGLVKSFMSERIWKNKQTAEFSRSLHALGRLGEPSDVAPLIAYLLQRDSGWVTGQVFGVDGGLARVRVPQM